MRNLRISTLRYWLKKWPGERLLGEYRFLPIFFCLGAALEFSMINWHVGQTNFYRTYKNKQVEEVVERYKLVTRPNT